MSEILNKAIVFAVEAHRNQNRKDGSPFILHPLEDASIVATLTSDESVMAAAVLHDTIEDTSVTEQQLREVFGDRIADLVMHETETKRRELSPMATWHLRKCESLQALAEADSDDTRILWLGDKLSNIRALRRQIDSEGDDTFEKFNNKNPLDHKWYYGSIVSLLESLADTAAYKELESSYHYVFDRFDDVNLFEVNGNV